jgi:hypothetical protein
LLLEFQKDGLWYGGLADAQFNPYAAIKNAKVKPNMNTGVTDIGNGYLAVKFWTIWAVR